jgi:N-acetylmuramic acid 6-phosphate etherase
VNDDRIDLSRITTESRNAATTEIDTLDTLGILQIINEQDQQVAPAVSLAIPRIAEAVDAIVTAFSTGGRLIYVGAGTSGRLGVLDASECPPTFNTDPKMVVGLIAGGDHALRHPIEQVEDRRDQGREDLVAIGLTEVDVVVGIAASGRTPYVLGAVQYASEIGCVTAGISNSAGSALSEAVDIPIEVPVGPEVITGSTRMKSGTAQKLVLNMLTTASMIRLGKTYGNLMVDVQPTNAKLRERSIRIVSEATGADEARARQALATSGDEVKTAIVSLLLGIPPEDARKRLGTTGGIVRAAVAGTRS